MKDTQVMNYLTLGVMLVIFCGLTWLLLDYIPDDCSKTKDPVLCNQLKYLDQFLPIGIISGIVIVALLVIFVQPDKPQSNKKSDI